jgi:hypothetical protein
MKGILTWSVAILLAFVILPEPVKSASSKIEVKPLYTLSNFSGHVPYNIVRLALDPASGEILVLDPRDGAIRVFNRTGMEIFRTSPYRDLGAPVDLTVEEDGTIDLLVISGGHFTIHRCNYRGEPVSELQLEEVPARFSDMRPNRILWNGGLLYLVDLDSLQVAVFDTDGRYVRGYLIADILGLEGQQADESTMFGFTVDRDGNLLFTIPVSFSAYRVSPSGSAPGEFAVVSGIAVDDRGFIFLSDRRRSVVMVYSPDLRFQHEFGYRGFGPGNLIVPDDLILDRTGKLYVTQMRKRGVQVYRVILADGSKSE